MIKSISVYPDGRGYHYVVERPATTNFNCPFFALDEIEEAVAAHIPHKDGEVKPSCTARFRDGKYILTFDAGSLTARQMVWLAQKFDDACWRVERELIRASQIVSVVAGGRQ